MKFKLIQKACKGAVEKNHFWLVIFMLSNNDKQACWRLQSPMIGRICTEKNIFGMILYSINFFNVLWKYLFKMVQIMGIILWHVKAAILIFCAINCTHIHGIHVSAHLGYIKSKIPCQSTFNQKLGEVFHPKFFKTCTLVPCSLSKRCTQLHQCMDSESCGSLF